MKVKQGNVASREREREREIRERCKSVEKQFGVGVTKICPSLKAVRQCLTVLLVELRLRDQVKMLKYQEVSFVMRRYVEQGLYCVLINFDINV